MEAKSGEQQHATKLHVLKPSLITYARSPNVNSVGIIASLILKMTKTII
jgi:hypothetical protein